MMHEHHAVHRLVDQVLDTALKNKVQKVNRVTIVINELSGFKESSVRHYFSEFTKDNILKDTSLEVKNVGPQFECTKCQRLISFNGQELHCSVCGGPLAPVKAEKQFYVEDIEVES